MRERSRLTACPQPNDFLAGAFTGKGDVANDPALKFLHGTTTLGFIFNGGIVLAVDSRASMGSYIGAPALLSVLSLFLHPSSHTWEGEWDALKGWSDGLGGAAVGNQREWRRGKNASCLC